MKKEKIIYPLTGGLIISLFMIIIQLLTLKFCNSDMLCLVIILIPTLPGSIIGFIFGKNLIGLPLIITTLIFYFLIGALIGWLVERYKK